MKSTLTKLSQPMAAMALVGVLMTSAIHIPAAYADTDPGRLIVTQGMGEVKAYPDSFEISVSVESQQDTANKARESLSQTTQRILSALKGLNISNMDIRTQSISLNPVQDYQQGKLPKTLGYRATNSVEVTVKRTGDAKQLGDLASKNYRLGHHSRCDQHWRHSVFYRRYDGVASQGAGKSV